MITNLHSNKIMFRTTADTILKSCFIPVTEINI